MASIFDTWGNNSNNVPSNMPRPCPPKPSCGKLDPKFPNEPYTEYDSRGQAIGYFWYYGSTVELVFSVDGAIVFEESDQYIPAAEFLESRKLSAQFFNYRGEKVFEKIFSGTNLHSSDETEDSYILNGTVTVVIKGKISTEIFTKGIYHCSLQLLDEDCNIDTLFSSMDCRLTVR